MKRALLILISLWTLSGCDRLATEVDVPIVQPQLVVNAFLSPELNETKVEVSISKPVFNSSGSSRYEIDFITNAAVVISNDLGFSATLAYVDSANGYIVSQTNYPIEPGKTYTIKVSADGKTATASTTIPQTGIMFSVLEFKKIATNPNTIGTLPSYLYTYKWNDEPGVKNYYRVDAESSWGGMYGEYIFCTNIWDGTLHEGAQLTGTCDDYSYVETKPFDITFYLLNTDIHYYEYHKRRLNYYGDDPFSEPVQQYSNVKGGLGIVCSYRQMKQTLSVTE